MIEAYRNALDDDNSLDKDKLISANTNDLIESMFFSQRRKLYKEMNDRISNFTTSKKLYFSEIIPEYLLYSNLGRSDLIYFDSWKKKYLEKNVS